MANRCSVSLVTDAAEWDALFSRVEHPHMVQSWAYGEAKQAAGVGGRDDASLTRGVGGRDDSSLSVRVSPWRFVSCSTSRLRAFGGRRGSIEGRSFWTPIRGMMSSETFIVL